MIYTSGKRLRKTGGIAVLTGGASDKTAQSGNHEHTGLCWLWDAKYRLHTCRSTWIEVQVWASSMKVAMKWKRFGGALRMFHDKLEYSKTSVKHFSRSLRNNFNNACKHSKTFSGCVCFSAYKISHKKTSRFWREKAKGLLKCWAQILFSRPNRPISLRFRRCEKAEINWSAFRAYQQQCTGKTVLLSDSGFCRN